MGMNNFTSGNGANGGNMPPSGGTPGGASPFSLLSPNQSEFDPKEILIDYNEQFKNGDPALFRDDLINQTLSVLIGKGKPNALLIGPAGTGKTKIPEEIARRIANKDPFIPQQLSDMTVCALPLSSLVAGSGFVGDLESRLQATVDYCEDPANKIILFVDEIHQLCNPHDPVYTKIAQILKPALARGKMRVIGATTTQEANNLAEDPAFNRRFTRLIVDELTAEQTLEILKNLKAGFFKHYQNKIALDDTTLETVVRLADSHRKAGSHRPDNAITLLDRAIGDAVIARHIMEEKAKNDPALLQAIRSVTLIPITETQIKKTAMRLMTGHAKKEATDFDLLQEKLKKIKGQDNAICKIIKQIKNAESELFPHERPASMLFAGESGVGKTEIVKILSEVLTGQKPIIINMTEFHSSASINRIIGSPAGYVGSESKAELPFDSLEANPYQIILLDEFEKANQSVQKLFMSALDEGVIKTSRQKDIDFSKAIIIATTNASHTNKQTTLGFAQTTETASDASVVKDLSREFPTELLNRFDKIITFAPLNKETYREILCDTYERERTRILLDHPRVKLPDVIPDDVLDELVKTTYIPEFGARPAGKAIKNYIEEQAV